MKHPGEKPAEVVASVAELLPRDLYRLTLEQGGEVLAHVAPRREKDFLRLLPGDRVRVKLAPGDPTRGRIVERYRP